MPIKGKYIFRYFNLFIVLILVLILASCGDVSEDETIFIIPEITYHNPDQLEKYLQETNQKYPDITYLEPVGTSVDDRTIWALVISDNPLEFEAEPKIRLTGSIHGDENVTTEVIVRLIDHITSSYNSGDPYIKELVDTRYIVLIPMMNPDGVSNDSRYNANYVDLNRNFDEQWISENNHGDYPFSEPESEAFKNYSLYMGFHLSLTYHSGAVIVNMPFDYVSLDSDAPAEYPLITYLAETYSTSGSFLENQDLLTDQDASNGTINGGDWYIIYGSLQDWSYIESGCVDLTVEISQEKQPETIQEIDEIFGYNIDSMLSYIEAGGRGVFGRIVDSSDSSKSIQAEIAVDGGDIVTHSDDYGYYHRILLPGNYTIHFTAAGYNSHSEVIEITAATSTIELDITMDEI